MARPIRREHMTPAARQLADAVRATKGGGHGKWKRDGRGRNHPSGEEADWFDVMYAREARGEFVIVEIEPAFPIRIPRRDGLIVEAFVAKLDMQIREPDGRVRWIDHKGRTGDTEVSRLKRRCVELQHGIEVELVGKWIERKARTAAKKKAERALLKASKQTTRRR